MILALTLFVLASAPVEPSIDVLLLSSHHLAAARLAGPRPFELAARGDELFVDGHTTPAPFATTAGRWTVTWAGGRSRAYAAELSISARRGELVLVARVPLERYVAGVVEAETAADAPPAALEAQAIVTRSWVLAGGRAHADALVCDLAHCQVFAGEPHGPRAEAVELAVRKTRGLVLRVPASVSADTPSNRKEIARAMFHASCGGHTADPAEVLGQPDPMASSGTRSPGLLLPRPEPRAPRHSEHTGARAVPDPGCAAPWRVVTTRSVVEAAAGRVLTEGSGVPGPAPLGALAFARGQGGFVVRLSDRRGRTASADAFTRALDRLLGHGKVRSARFVVRPRGEAVEIEGSGLGHGLGLCQAGAARLARRGASARDILRHYFPDAELGGL